jgi:hypothetical protein
LYPVFRALPFCIICIAVVAEPVFEECQNFGIFGVLLMTCRNRRLTGLFKAFATAFLCISLCAPCALAQQGGRNGSDLYTLIEQAQAYVVAGRWQSAINVYLDAWKLSRDPGYLYNIAVLYLVRLKDDVKALEFAEKYVAQARTDSEKLEAEGLIKRIKDNISGTHGKLTVTVTPKSAESKIFVDGKRLGDDNWVVAGNHILGVEAPGYLPYSREVAVIAGTETALAVTLKTVEGQLAVRCSAGRCVISVDGEDIGEGSVFKKLSPGEHSVEVTSGGSTVFSDWVVIESGMQKLVSVAVDTARVDIQSVEMGVDSAAIVTDVALPVVEKDSGAAWAKNIETSRKNSKKIGPQKAAAISMWVISAVAAGAGTGVFFMGQDKINSAGDIKPSDYPRYSYYEWEYNNRVKNGELLAYVGYGSWGLSAAALVVGLALWFTAPVDMPVVFVPAGPDGPGATAIVRW